MRTCAIAWTMVAAGAQAQGPGPGAGAAPASDAPAAARAPEVKPDAAAQVRDQARGQARALIELAVARGVPLFNAGQPEGCAGVYEVAAQALSVHAGLDERQRARVAAGLARARAEGDASRRAWALRGVLDELMAEIVPQEALLQTGTEERPLGTMPAMAMKDLNGRELQLPGELPGERTLVLAAFLREQQADIDTWVEGMNLREAGAPEWLELPVVGDMSAVRRAFLDNGMRMGIRAQEARARVVTLYTARDAWVRAMGLGDGEAGSFQRVYAAVVDRQGRVLAVAPGRYSPGAAEGLLAVLRGETGAKEAR